LAALATPVALAEELGRGVMNVPYFADQAGQYLAKASLEPNIYQKVDDYTQAATDLLTAFGNAGGLFTLRGGGLSGESSALKNQIHVDLDFTKMMPEANVVWDRYVEEILERLGAITGKRSSLLTPGSTRTLPFLHHMDLGEHAFDVLYDFFPEHDAVVIRGLVNIVFK
jgi:hypothetical protein